MTAGPVALFNWQNTNVCSNVLYHLLFFSSELSTVTSSTLNQELESIEQLHELEPDNKCKTHNNHYYIEPIKTARCFHG